MIGCAKAGKVTIERLLSNNGKSTPNSSSCLLSILNFVSLNLPLP